MLESMTGSAKSSTVIADVPFSIFIKSINHKFFDINLRLPVVFQQHEEEFLRILRKYITRGRVDLEIISQNSFQLPVLNQELMNRYMEMVGADQSEIQKDRKIVLELLKLPGILSVQDVLPKKFPLKELLQFFESTVIELQKSRRKEGEKIQRVITTYLKDLEGHKKSIQKLTVSGKKDYINRFKEEMLPLIGDHATVDWKELAPGIADWYERSDITEELERIQMHLSELRDIMKTGDDAGKRIEFYAQELHREVNTISSKKKDFHIRSRAVEMKNIIEKMKEQVRNIC